MSEPVITHHKRWHYFDKDLYIELEVDDNNNRIDRDPNIIFKYTPYGSEPQTIKIKESQLDRARLFVVNCRTSLKL